MDDGPFRVPQSGRASASDRRAPSRPEPVAVKRAEPVAEPDFDEPAPVRRPAAPARPKKEVKPAKRFKLPFIILAILILGIIGWVAISKLQGGKTAIDGGKYQAVFLTNDQVYFGKLESFNGEYLRLTDIYYLQAKATDAAVTSENPQQTTADQSNVQLLKLGDEIHGPEDAMLISKDQVLFYENLKEEGKVAQSIKNFKATK